MRLASPSTWDQKGPSSMFVNVHLSSPVEDKTSLGGFVARNTTRVNKHMFNAARGGRQNRPTSYLPLVTRNTLDRIKTVVVVGIIFATEKSRYRHIRILYRVIHRNTTRKLEIELTVHQFRSMHRGRDCASLDLALSNSSSSRLGIGSG